MTAIVGLVHDNRVYIGGDSAGVAGYSLTVRADTKVFRNGPYVLGFTSSFRMGQILRHAFTPPAPTVDLDRFMATTYIDAVRESLKAGGFGRKEFERESGGVFIVGVNGRLFRIESDYQVGEALDGFDAVGCGDGYALGAMHVTDGQPPKARIRAALSAAEHFSAGVRGPFTIVSVRNGAS